MSEEKKKLGGCRPHAWKVPEAGDDDLVCLKCGRCMGLGGNIRDHPGVNLRGKGAGYGTEPGEVFRQAFNVAYLDALDRSRNLERCGEDGAVSVEVERRERREPELTKDLRLRIFNYVRFGMTPEQVSFTWDFHRKLWRLF